MKQKGKLAILFMLAALLVVINFRQESAPSASPSAGTDASVAAGPRGSFATPEGLLEVRTNEPLRREAATSRNIFEYGSLGRKKPKGAGSTTAQAPANPEPKVEEAPPAPLHFYGFADLSAGGKRRVFLTDGEDVFVAQEGDVIKRRFRVERVGRKELELKTLAGDQRWILPLVQP